MPEFLKAILERTKRMKVGDPSDPETHMGALISSAHLEKVLGFINSGVAEGAELVTGGRRLEVDYKKRAIAAGNFMSPAIFKECKDSMAICREEIFGPVMSVLSFDTEEEVVERANNTPFGLAAGVFTKDIQRGHRVVHNLEAGTCWINNYNITPIELPFGGYKQSGFGRENSFSAIHHYTQVKSIYVELGNVDAPF
jgi:betaine-aldehyde dehydrogenase